MALPQMKASFIWPMLLRPTNKLPEGSNWLYELKLDGFRAIAFKTNGKPHLRSRNGSRLGKAPRDHEWTPGRREAYQSCCASSRNLVGRRIGHIVGLYLRGFLKQFVQFSQHFRIAPAVVSVRLLPRIP
jgi:hypothetical protein